MPRILILDEHQEIHDEYRKILAIDAKIAHEESRPTEENLNLKYFNGVLPTFEIDSALSILEAREKIESSVKEKNPYCLLILDFAMATAEGEFWVARNLRWMDKNMQFIMTVDTTHPVWEPFTIHAGYMDFLSIIKKPFAPLELQFAALSLSEKWRMKTINNEQINALARSNELMIVEKMKADQANTAKSEFLANMSHEIRTPLNILMGINEVLSNTELTEEQLNYLSISTRSGEQLLRLLNNLLDLSKIEAGKETVVAREFNTSSFFSNILQTFKFKADTFNVKFSSHLGAHLPKALICDNNKFKIILSNLIDNAIKFSSNESVFVKFIREEDLADGTVLIKGIVKDTGIGMPKQSLDRIFKSFVQIDSSRAKKYPGTGLGLSITYNYIKLMGGSITVESEEGKGSEFTFILPMKIGASDKLDVEAKPPAPQKKISDHLRILLAEDNEENVQLMKIYMEKEDVEIDVGINGQEALDLYHQNKYDVIFMDMQMPIMDGFEATKTIRKHEEDNNLPRIPLIALTAFSRSNEIDACLTAGCDDVFRKPVKRTKIISYLQSLIDQPEN